MTWLRSVDRLSRSGPSEVADAHLQLRELARLARALAPLSTHEGPCEPGRCLLARRPHGPALCALVPCLAALDVGPLTPSQVAATADDREDVATLVGAYARAVEDAVDVVRWCRQTAHPNGACWFASPEGRDCGAVLKLAHGLADASA